MPEAEKPKNLTQKLAEIALTLTWMKKRGKVAGDAYGYNFATEADLVMMIRKEIFERNIFLYPLTISHEVTTAKGKTTVKNGVTTESVKQLTKTTMQWKWVDGDTGEFEVCSMPGCGEDSGDKGTAKSITMSEKYFLLKSFLIPTFDDNEKMNSSEKEALQRRVGEEKKAELQAKIAAQQAQSPEEAQAELKKSKVMFITMPDRFDGDYAAVYGNAIQSEVVIAFMSDCGAQRFKGPEGILYKLEAQYAHDCKELAKKQGFTVKAELE